MERLNILTRIKELYSENKNIMEYLRSQDGRSYNTTEDILISYDFQSGSYTKFHLQNPEIKERFCLNLAKELERLGEFDSILEAGVGEATTLGNLLVSLKSKPKEAYGFDLSWSRIKYARHFLDSLNLTNVQLFTGDLFCSPIKDNSIDIVYTTHSIEPNGGREKEALSELYRITRKYLILLEPAYELAGEEARRRMINLGYITNLHASALELGLNVVDYRLFGESVNPLNPTGLMIIKKDFASKTSNPLCCPLTKTKLIKKNNGYFSKESLLAYPIIDKIPCLLSQNAIVATHFMDKPSPISQPELTPNG